MDFFDFENVEDESSVIPQGAYDLCVDEATFKDAKSGEHSYLNVRFKVIAGNHEGRMFYEIFNVMHPTPKTRNIAMAKIKKILVSDGSEAKKIEGREALIDALLGKTFNGNVKVKTDDYGEKNVLQKVNGSTTVPNDTPF